MLLQNDDTLIGGIDESGRGSIIGPLVIAGVGIYESKITTLREMGVKDSKKLMPKVRDKLFDQITKVADTIYIHKINPIEVDGSVMLKGLNKLEAKVMAIAINNIRAKEVYVDCCDVNPQRYKAYLEHHLTCSTKIYSMHHADVINVVVSAASIIAKSTRDQEIQKIRANYHNIGSGYPSDERTMEFIKCWVKKYGSAPEFARKSWRPLKIMLGQTSQRKI